LPSRSTWQACADLKRAQLPTELRFHDLRHSWVALLGDANVDVAVVSKMAGHSSVSLIWNTYRHVFEKPQREAAETMDRILGGGA